MRVFTVASGMARYLGDFTHRFLVIIDEVYNLTVRRRQARHALAKNFTSIFLLQHGFGIICQVHKGRRHLVV